MTNILILPRVRATGIPVPHRAGTISSVARSIKLGLHIRAAGGVRAPKSRPLTARWSRNAASGHLECAWSRDDVPSPSQRYRSVTPRYHWFGWLIARPAA